MMSLEKEISRAKFERLPREVYAIHSNNGSLTHFLTKETAYSEMDNVKRTLELAGDSIDRIELNDLDVRIDLIVTTGGSVYSLLTLPIRY